MAVRQGDHYVLNGRKCFITSGGMADFLSVFAVTTPGKGARGISLLAVERATPGISLGKVEDKMGMRGSQTAEVIFEAARALVYKTAAMADLGHQEELRKFASMSKCFGSDVAMKVTTDVVQIFGGYGYMRDYPVECMMRDAKLTQIFDGTNQIHRMVIVSGIFRD